MGLPNLIWSSPFLDSLCTYDAVNKYAFVADYSGQVNVLKLDTSGFQLITTLKGHQSECALVCADFHKDCSSVVGVSSPAGYHKDCSSVCGCVGVCVSSPAGYHKDCSSVVGVSSPSWLSQRLL